MSRQQFVGIRSGSRGAFHLGLIRHELIFTFYGFIMPMPVGQWRSYQNVYQVCHGATGLGQRLDADYLVLCAEERILCALGAATRGGMARPMPGPRSEERHGQTPANRQMLSRATVLKLGLPLLRRGRRTLSMRKYSYLVQSKAENRRQNIIGLRKRRLLVRLERLFRRAFCGY